MSIPKHLILYKTPRHHHTYPFGLKYGLYSNKINQEKIKHYKHQRKLIKETSFEFNCPRVSEDLGTLSLFTRLSGITMFSLSFADIPRLIQISTKLPIKVMKSSFTKLKRIKQLTIHHLYQLQKNPKAFKNLLLLNSLESLTLYYLTYSDDSNSLKPLMQALSLSSRRKIWPHFKSLKIHPFSPEGSFTNPENPHNVEFLKRLLEFLQDLQNSCKDLYKCLSFQIDLPYLEHMTQTEVESLSEISNVVGPMTRLKALDVQYFSKLSEIFLQAKNLRKVSINMCINFGDAIDLSPLNKASGLTELKVLIRTGKRADILLYKTVFTQIQCLSQLTSLSLKLLGTQTVTDELIQELAQILRNLPELKSLDLSFMDRLTRRNAFSELKSHVCFEEIFQVIGKKRELKEFSLYFSRFAMRNSDYLLRVLCQSLEDLSLLSRLSLSIDFVPSLGDEEIFSLAQSLSKLTNIEDLFLKISTRDHYLGSKGFVLLAENMTNSCFYLTQVTLQFGLLTIDDELFLALEKAIQNLIFLNEIKFRFEGKLETKFDPQLLQERVDKKMSGSIILGGSTSQSLFD